MNPPDVVRSVAFIDGQNLFNGAKEAFGYDFPNYDPQALARKVAQLKGWEHKQTHFYTGVPDPQVDPSRNHFWNAKKAVLGTRGVRVFTRPLRYRNERVRLPDGTTTTVLVGREKGIDIRMALDVVRLARERIYDAAILFTQDQDFSEVADEVRAISAEQGRWIGIASAFPFSPTSNNQRGVNGTDWVKMDRAFYDACIDPNDYRQKRA